MNFETFAFTGWIVALLLLGVVAWLVYCLDKSTATADELRLELAREQAGRSVVRLIRRAQ